MSVFSLKLRNSGSRKCAMPNCLTGTTAKSNKKYVAVPKQFRERWLAAAGITKTYSPYTKIFFCQDHFDVRFLFYFYIWRKNLTKFNYMYCSSTIHSPLKKT